MSFWLSARRMTVEPRPLRSEAFSPFAFNSSAIRAERMNCSEKVLDPMT